MKTQKKISSALILFGLVFITAAPLLAAVDYSFPGGSELRPEIDWKTPLSNLIVTMFLVGLGAAMFGMVVKLVSRSNRQS
jgi:hypothetical protein